MRTILEQIVLFMMCGLFIGCNMSSKDSSAAELKVLPRIVPQELVDGGCLSVSALHSRFEKGSAHYPALSVTSHFVADVDLNSTKKLFQIFSAFDIRDVETQDVRFLNQPVQIDCKQVSAKTISGEDLTFQLSQQSENEVSLVLQNSQDPSLSRYRKEGLKNKKQPIRYDVLVLDPTHLRIVTTYRGFDPHCRSEKVIISKIQRDYYWAPETASLPSQVLVNEAFFQSFLSTLQPEGLGNYEIVPQPDGYALVNVTDMRSLLTKSVKDELSKCVF